MSFSTRGPYLVFRTRVYRPKKAPSYIYIYYIHIPKDDFNLTFDRRRFLVDTQRRLVVFYFAQEIFFFIFFSFYPLFIFDRTVSSRHVLLPATTVTPSNFDKKQERERESFISYFVRPCTDFTYEDFFPRYLLCGPKMTIKIIM